MKISTKGRYGLRALVDLSINAKDDPIVLSSVAERQGISVQYLEHVFSTLRKAGIVRSIKGPKGGYVIAVPTEELKVSVILKALEGNLSIMDALQLDESESGNCIEKAICNKLWQPLDASSLSILEDVSLADLINESKLLDTSESVMFFI